MGERSKQLRRDRLRKLAEGPYLALTIRFGRRYLRDYPEDGWVWYLVANALMEMARYEEAEQANAKALEYCPPDRIRIPLSQLGHLHQEAGDYNQAAEWFQRAIEADPNNAGGFIYLGAVRSKQGRFSEAEEAYLAATHCIHGCIDEAHYNLGIILLARERFEAAAECFREAIRLDPEYRAAKVALRDAERCSRLK